MASPPPASSSSYSSLETFLLSEIGDLAPDDIFLCARPKHRNRRLLQVAKKTCYTGSSEQDIAKDGKQYSPRPDERSKHSHECILDPPRTSVFILDSTATSHVVGDVSLFSPSFRSRTPTTPAGTAPPPLMRRTTGGSSPSPASAPYPATTSASPTRGVSQTSVPDSTWSPCSSLLNAATSSCSAAASALSWSRAAAKSSGKGGCTPTMACTTSSSSIYHTTKPVKIARQ